MKVRHSTITVSSHAGVPTGNLHGFLEALDIAPLGGASALKNQHEKDQLETEIWMLAYKRDQMRYHQENLTRLLAADTPEPGPRREPIEHDTHVTSDCRPAFELNAFLAALRSALDNCAHVAGTFLKGYKRGKGSIAPLGTKVAAYAGTNPLLVLLRDHWTRWIAAARDYRDHVVHRVSVRTSTRSDALKYTAGTWDAETETVSTAEQVLRPVVPVVIPRQPQARQITRKRWFYELSEHDSSPGHVIMEGHSSVSVHDGRSFTTHRELVYSVANTHVELGSFISQLATSFERFVGELLACCAGLSFATVTERF